MEIFIPSVFLKANYTLTRQFSRSQSSRFIEKGTEAHEVKQGCIKLEPQELYLRPLP